jgi:hypothetical protein
VLLHDAHEEQDQLEDEDEDDRQLHELAAGMVGSSTANRYTSSSVFNFSWTLAFPGDNLPRTDLRIPASYRADPG